MKNLTSQQENSQKAYQSLIETMANKQTLEKRKAELKSAVGNKGISVRGLETSLRDVRNAIKGNLNSNTEDSRALLTKYQNDEKAIALELSRLRDSIQEATDEMAAIDKKLNFLGQGASADEVAVHQSIIIDLSEKIQQLQELIDEQHGFVGNARDGFFDLADLHQKRDDLLADIALGEATQEQLDPIDAEIAKMEQANAEQQAEKEKLAARANQVISGLVRKQQVLKLDLEKLERVTPKIMDQFLMNEAAAVAKVYQEQAKQAIVSLTRLAALERLITEQGERSAPIFLTGNERQTFIPDSLINPVAPTVGPGILFKGLYPNSDLVIDAVKAERERFEAMGICWP
ncbi:hypothetical protein [Sedimenticola selenatireducens]|uniref:hypothetical protein n=1 Tax=Sedimenticola selenatireducens TaxID=191960 RepID=UPI0004907994|nr:hypothetical protein [Sedimenticola selenatireducens]